MCMIAYRPLRKSGHGSNIPNSVIDTAISRHPDGFGFAWREGGKLMTEKYGPADRKAFRKALRALDRRTDVEYVVHFRMATHGPKIADLAHPYTYDDPIEGPVVVFHNGIINIKTEAHESDTQVFVRDVLAELPSAWWRNSAIAYLVGESIGWSRLVLMTGAETVNLQESDGEWANGIWYSSNHKPAYQAPTTGAGWTSHKTNAGATVFTPTGGDDAGAYADYVADVMKARREDADRRSESSAATTSLAKPARNGNGSSALVAWRAARDVDSYGWHHGGHDLTAMRDIDRSKDGDYAEGVICNVCYTIGDVYVIEGTPYIEMGHRTADGALADDREEEALLINEAAGR